MKALPQASAGANFHIGIMAGKLNGVMPATTPSGWRMEKRSMPGPAPSVVFALEQVRNAAGEFDHLQAALHVAFGVGESLAVLGGQKPRQLIEFLLRQIEEFHHHAGTPLRIGGGPAGLRRFRNGDGMLDFGPFGECDLGLHLAGIGIENVAEPPRSPLHLFAADEVADLAHELSPWTKQGHPGRPLL